MRLIVAGGRSFTDAARLNAALQEALGDYPLDKLRIVSGGAKGADLLGEQWAQSHGVPVDRYDAKWDDIEVPGAVVGVNFQGRQYNKLAGYQRNDLMAENADAVLVMPGGNGTAHMAKAMAAKGLTVFDARGDRLVRSGPALPMPEQPAAQVELAVTPFEIVASRGPGAQFDVLGMRANGATMASVKAPGEPGWLGNPFIAKDAGGALTREEATQRFGELVQEKAQDPAWREAFLGLEGKRVGYYKPEEKAIHLHELQKWITAERGKASAAAGDPAPVVPSVMPEQPAAAVNPTGQQTADAVQLGFWDEAKRKAGQAWPYLAAAGGAGLLGYAVADLMADAPPQQGVLIE